jgi:F-type H+-transporting ATPase subunit delta
MKSPVAKRYAKALFEIALERNLLDEVEKELQLVVDAFSALPTLREWLSHPKTGISQKKDLFSSVFSHLSEITLNLLFLLTDRHRENEIEDIAHEYKALANEEKGIAEAVVTSAYPLSEQDKKELVATFQKLIGKTIHITEVVDSDILGGVIVRIGDRLYDGSLKTKLIRFQERLKSAQVG